MNASTSTVNDARSIGNELKNNLGSVGRDVKDSAIEAKDYVAKAAHDTAQLGKDAASRAGDSLKGAADTLSVKAHKAADAACVARDKVSSFIEERPFTSVLIAFGVGAVISRLINSTKH